MIESGRFRLNFGLARLAMGAAIAVTLLLALSASRAHAATEIGAVPTGAEIDLLKKTKLKLKKSKSSTKQLGRLLRNTRKGSKLKLTVTATNHARRLGQGQGQGEAEAVGRRSGDAVKVFDRQLDLRRHEAPSS